MKPLEQPAKKKRILLAEKESTGRYLLLQQLNKAGLEVELAPNGALALKKLAEGEVDAIILDSSLPDIKGQDIIKQIRRKKGLEATPIFVCASDAHMNEWKGTKTGVTKVFDKKTSTVDEIVADVLAHLGGVRKRPAPLRPSDKNAPEGGGSRGSKLNLPPMSDEIRLFEISRDKPMGEKRPAPATPPPMP